MIHPADPPAMLETANGALAADTQVLMHAKGIMDNIDPYLLHETPDVLSIGTRCELHGFAFHWYPYSKHPYFVSPSGKEIPLVSLDQ